MSRGCGKFLLTFYFVIIPLKLFPALFADFSAKNALIGRILQKAPLSGRDFTFIKFSSSNVKR